MMHSPSPLLILYACFVLARVEAPSPVLSHDTSEVNVEHVSFTTEDNGLIYADLYGKGGRGWCLRMAVALPKRAGNRKPNP